MRPTRDVQRGGESDQLVRLLVDGIRAYALDRPARPLPSLLLPRILAPVDVKRRAVDLDEGTLRRPAQVRLFAFDADV